MIANIAAALVLTAGMASAEMKLGRTAERGKGSGNGATVFGTQSSVHAVPAAPAAPSRSAAAPRSFAAQQQPQRAAPQNSLQRSAYGGSGFRRSDDGGGAAPSGPQPQAGALIRTAGAGSKVEADNSHRWHSVEAGYPQPGGKPLGGFGVTHGVPDKLPGQNAGSGAGTNPFGSSGVSSHQSWIDGINSGPNINVNNGNTNGGGNGNGNGNGNR